MANFIYSYIFYEGRVAEKAKWVQFHNFPPFSLFALRRLGLKQRSFILRKWKFSSFSLLEFKWIRLKVVVSYVRLLRSNVCVDIYTIMSWSLKLHCLCDERIKKTDLNSGGDNEILWCGEGCRPNPTSNLFMREVWPSFYA